MRKADVQALLDFNYWAIRRLLEVVGKVTEEHWTAPPSHHVPSDFASEWS